MSKPEKETKETKEQKEQRLKAVRKKLSAKAKSHSYNLRLLEKFKTSGESKGLTKYKLSKEVISERTAEFKNKYLSDNSAFQKRLAYLQGSMSDAEYKETPEYKISLIINDLIDTGIEEYSEYANDTQVYSEYLSKSSNSTVKNFRNNISRKEETKHLKNAMKSFEETERKLSEFLNTEYGHSDSFSEIYEDVKEMKDSALQSVEGGLYVPEPDPDAYKVLHVKLEENGQIVEPKLKKVTRTEIDPVTKKEKTVVAVAEKDITWEDAKDEPLFSHEPCPEDIQQGCVGDCYYIASMMSIANTNPDFIRNCLKDNHDGTVTVRLYSGDEHETVYVTVNKTVPVIGKDGEKQPLYARGALWVSMLEKAYIQSGVFNDVSNVFAGGDLDYLSKKGYNTYKSIEGGKTHNATYNILGHYSQQWPEDMQIEIPTGGVGEYTDAEKNFFNKVKKAYLHGDAVTAGAIKLDKKESDSSYEFYKGLPGGHAYSIIGTETKGGKLYIKVQNPHASGGRAYDENGEPYYDRHPEIPGVSSVELRDFTQTFGDCYAASYSDPIADQVKEQLVKDHKALYKDAVKQVCDEIKASDPWYVSTNSEKFKNLKLATISLEAQYKKADASVEDLDKSLNEFFKAAKEYKDYRDARPEDKKKDSKSRSMERYRLVDAVSRFESIYKANQNGGMEYVDFDLCKEAALDVGMDKDYEHASRAKKATVEGLVKDPKGHTSDAVSAEAKMNEVESKGLENIENGLKNNSTKDLIKGLSQVLVSRGVKGNKDTMRPQDIERQLSDEAIDRSTTLLENKLEEALKSIDKQEFLEIIGSGNVGDNMVKSVEKHITENEKKPELKPDVKSNEKQMIIH